MRDETRTTCLFHPSSLILKKEGPSPGEARALLLTGGKTGVLTCWGRCRFHIGPGPGEVSRSGTGQLGDLGWPRNRGRIPSRRFRNPFTRPSLVSQVNERRIKHEPCQSTFRTGPSALDSQPIICSINGLRLQTFSDGEMIRISKSSPLCKSFLCSVRHAA